MVGFASALPTLRLDSRFRGNDRTGAVRLRWTGGLGLRVRNSLESLFDKEGLREFGGIRGLTHPPCHDGAAGRCREFEGVPQFSFLLSPKIGGQRGLKRAPREGRWVSRPLYPPYTWIPAFAGMTEVEKGD